MKKSKFKSYLAVLGACFVLFLSFQNITAQEKSDKKESVKKEQVSAEKKEMNNKQVEQEKKAQGQDSKDNNSQKEAKTTNTLLELFKLGGPFMWPLLLFSVIVIAVILERGIVYSGQRFNMKKLSDGTVKLIKAKKFNEAIEICKSLKRNVASEIFIKSIPGLKRNIGEFEKSLEAHSTVKVSRLEKNLNILSTMGNIAPLTGFLGTVSGMITAFKTIALSDNVTARLVAGGIYEALITTAFGLIIAIIAVGGNNFFVHKVDSSVKQIEETGYMMIEAVSEEN